MSPRWAEVAGYGLYFYFAERHQRPHVSVVRGGSGAILDVQTGEILAGNLPPRVLRQFLVDLVRRLKAMAEHETFAPIIPVSAVQVLGRYVLQLGFANGEVRVIDVEPMLWGPAFERVVKDYEFFKQVRVDRDSGTIAWPNGVDLSPVTLYQQSKPAVPA